MSVLDEYEAFMDRSVIDELRLLAGLLQGRRILTINTTRTGGGVAEILTRMVPLLGELGVEIRWELLEGSEAFFKVTKKIHNALHGRAESLEKEAYETFLEVTERNLSRLRLDADFFLIHDPQPMALIQRRSAIGGRWVWRCHIDLSQPQQDVWTFLRPFALHYDAVVCSAPSFAQQLPMRQLLIAPSIDPLSPKNQELSPETVGQILHKLGVPQDRPIITQVSRFDYLKDPLGVIDAFLRVRKSVKCRLVLAGGPASDDPEAEEVLNLVRERAGQDPEIHLLMLPPNSDIEINALQRASAVVVQKSIREGFGLTVAEALWKGRPVVASAVGGIPLQVKHGYSGLLVRSVEGAAEAIKQLLLDGDYAKRLGANGREHVRQNFLLLRQIRDYLATFVSLDHEGDVIELDGR